MGEAPVDRGHTQSANRMTQQPLSISQRTWHDQASPERARAVNSCEKNTRRGGTHESDQAQHRPCTPQRAEFSPLVALLASLSELPRTRPSPLSPRMVQLLFSRRIAYRAPVYSCYSQTRFAGCLPCRFIHCSASGSVERSFNGCLGNRDSLRTMCRRPSPSLRRTGGLFSFPGRVCAQRPLAVFLRVPGLCRARV